MEELYVEGLATCGGPESCVVACEGGGEALTGVRAGRAIEPRNVRFGVPALSQWRKATSAVALSRATVGPRVVKEPGHVRNLHAREPGEPVSARPADHRAGRPGNAKAVMLG
jgi:hypothetical protein